ncbi:hypothetical protein [Streptomyces sp. NPDC048644]|uniref:SCO2584 family spore wall biosynthesis protein n=1 Tax=Streptomyces sp. NPDC048644 TaxID=3365582 RepID=UPI00371EB067
MPDDVGGKPFPDGDQPDEHGHGSHGSADEEFASVVFDEAFVRAAQIHEPSAVERLLAAAEARAEAEARPGTGLGPDHEGAEGLDGGPGTRARRRARRDPDGFDPEADDYDTYDEYAPYDPYGPYGGALRPYRTARWHRPVAWVLALVMGVGLVALAFAAVYRGASGKAPNPAPRPASSGVDSTQGGGTAASGRPGLPPSASAGSAPPSASAVPRPH